MPLRLSAGIQKKIGLPEYGSLGSSCSVELELDGSLLEPDPAGFQQQVQEAFAACSQAVEEELARQTECGDSHASNGDGSNGNGHARPPTQNGQNGQNGAGENRRATRSQVRALHAIATRQRFDLTDELRRRFGLYRAEDLSLSQASALIQEFNAPINGSRA